MSEFVLVPPGRLILGSIYEPQTKDLDGNPLTDKNGQPRVQYYIGVGIRKGAETHWSQTEWGQKMWIVGNESFPKHAGLPTFAWKIKDGDSVIPDKEGRIPNQREGHAGHWIINFTNGFAPTVVNSDGSQIITQKDFVNRGDYIEIACQVKSNESQKSPGIFLNFTHVAFSRYGERLASSTIDPKTIGFGKAPAPAEGSLVPLSQGFNPASTDIVTASVSATPLPLVPRTPYPQILNAGAPSIPAVPPMPAAPIKMPVMLPAANGGTYEQYIAAGWSDATLIQFGMMAP
jgi:hypothetical protein